MYLIPTLFLCLSLGTIKKHVQFANGLLCDKNRILFLQKIS